MLLKELISDFKLLFFPVEHRNVWYCHMHIMWYKNIQLLIAFLLLIQKYIYIINWLFFRSFVFLYCVQYLISHALLSPPTALVYTFCSWGKEHPFWPNYLHLLWKLCPFLAAYLGWATQGHPGPLVIIVSFCSLWFHFMIKLTPARLHLCPLLVFGSILVPCRLSVWLGAC